MNWTMFVLLIIGAVLVGLAFSRLKHMKAFTFKNKRIEKRKKIMMLLAAIGLLTLLIGLLPYIF
jgi:heme/copper-type cytochrome/quinol oxidase subunit 2